MISLFRALFDKDKVEALEFRLKRYETITESLEAQVKENKEYKLKYKIAKMYIDDDEALLELISTAQKKARNDSSGDYVFDRSQGQSQLAISAQAQAMGVSGLHLNAFVGLGGLGGRW